jgi:hypothetical protein
MTPAVAAWSAPITTLKTPRGIPTSSASCASAIAESGVSIEGRKTTVQPATSAGATLRAGIAAGKFQGVSAPTTPTGCGRTRTRRSVRAAGWISP